MTNPQLQLKPCGPVAPPPPGAGPQNPPHLTEDLTFPTSKATAEHSAERWRLYGYDVGIEQRGRRWVVVETTKGTP